MERMFFNYEVLMKNIISNRSNSEFIKEYENRTDFENSLKENTVDDWKYYKKSPLKEYKNLNKFFVCCNCSEEKNCSKEYAFDKLDCNKVLIPLSVSSLVNHIIATSNAYEFNDVKITDNAKKVFVLLITLGIPGKHLILEDIILAGKKFGYNRQGIEKGLSQLCNAKLVVSISEKYWLDYNSCRDFLKQRKKEIHKFKNK